jgi:hypothetical protein
LSTTQLGIEIEGIALNVGPPTQPPVTSAPMEDDGSPSKKHRFQMRASPRQPASTQFFISANVFTDVSSLLHTLLYNNIIDYY